MAQKKAVKKGTPRSAKTATAGDKASGTWTAEERDRLAVNELTLRVPRGGVFGFLGPNGSGKTTTMGMLLGLVWSVYQRGARVA